MIRYVLILVIATVVLGLTGAALDGATAIRGEQAIEAELSTVESAATSLYELESTPPRVGDGSARRVVEVDVPDGTRTRKGTSFLRFEPIPNAEATRVIYRVEGATNRTRVIDVPLQRPDGGPMVLAPRSGTHRLVLELGKDADNNTVVVVSAYGEPSISDPTI